MLSISRNFKLLKENIKDAYMIAYHDNLEGEFTQQQMNIVFQDRAKRKSLNFIEMYSKPLFAQEKLLFFFEAMTMIGKTISILLFVVFPVLNWWLFLSLLVGFSILSYLLRISLAKWAFRRAIIRWVHKYHEQLNRNPPNKTSLLTKYNLREEDLNGWLEAQIRVLCMNNIHPDLAKIDELAPVQ
jgi:hypothetical protein